MTSSVAIATKQVDADKAGEYDLIRSDHAATIGRKVLPTPRIRLLNESGECDLACWALDGDKFRAILDS